MSTFYLPWDLWRIIFSFLNIEHLSSIFRVRYFQPTHEHQQFWITLFLRDYPRFVAKILAPLSSDGAADGDVQYKSWPEIRQAYQLLHVNQAQDFSTIDVKQLGRGRSYPPLPLAFF